jgi:hypothetical protein
VYAAAFEGDIYKQTGGTGSFVVQNAGGLGWQSITSTPSGDVYAVAGYDDIYKQTGSNIWEAQNAGSLPWTSITSTPSGDVYAMVSGGDIYKQTGGQGAFEPQNAGNQYWSSITSTPSGDIYAVVPGGDIYKQTSFHSLGGTITINNSLTGDITAETINITGTDTIDIRDNTYTAINAMVIGSPAIQTNNSTYVYTGVGDFVVNNVTYTYPIGLQGYNGVYNPVIYYFSNITDTDWNTLTNWCTGAYCGEQGATAATQLPISIDQVIINGDILSNSGLQAVADTVVFTNTSTNAISIEATQGVSYTGSSSLIATTTSSIISFEDTASLVGKVYTSVARFYNDTSSAVLGMISGVASGAFVAQNAGNQYWTSITSTPSGDVYVTVTSGDIYKQTGGTGAFVAQNAGGQNWTSITSTPNGDAYAVTAWSGNDDIYKLDHLNPQDGFVAQNAGGQNWTSITSTPNGDAYAVAYGGDIYKLDHLNPQDGFVAQNAGNQYWRSITSTPSGDVYAVAGYGDIYKQTGGTGAFVAQNAGSLGWRSITSTPSGDVYAVDGDYGDIYKQTGGQGAFEPQNAGGLGWQSITSTPSGDVYAAVSGDDIYKLPAGKDTWQAEGAGNREWQFITSTPSGDVYAVAYGGDIYKQSALVSAERIYTESSTTTRDFTTEGGVDTWTIIAQRAVGSFVDVVVDITGAIYDLTKNIFKAFTGAIFISGTDINNLSTPVVPELIPSLPAHNQTVTKWLPSVDWGDTATTCEYSYDNWTTTNTINCLNNGSDIERPQAGSHTLSLRATNQYGSFKEEDISFTYDNTVPTYTMCGSDLLDEATRPYYYLASDITENCTATVNTELRGTTTTTTIGYTLTGDVIANAKNISLKFIHITGSVTTSGTSDGEHAGSITIATSTTGTLYANGANGTADGGDGGDITIINSIGVNGSSTPIFANGGNSISCGNGGDGGHVILTNSTYGTISAEGGDASTQGCSNQTKTSGQRRTPTVTGTYTPPSSGGNTGGDTGGNTSNSTGGNSSTGGTLRGLIKNVVNPINFTPLPSLSPFIPSPSIIGATLIPNPFKDFQPPGAIQLIQLPVNFLTNISRFLFAPIPNTITDALSSSPRLQTYMASVGIAKEQDLATLATNPVSLQNPSIDNTPPGLFIVTSGTQELTSYATYDKAAGGLAQLVKTAPNQSLTISLIPQSQGDVTATYLGHTVTFTQSTPFASTYIETPSQGGRYILKTTSSPIPLLIDVIEPPQTEPIKKENIFIRIWKWLTS